MAKVHINQILSLVNIKYPLGLQGKDSNTLEKRKNFGKTTSKYKLDDNGRLCINNPLNKNDEKNIYYRIPLNHEKNNIINDIHIKNNHFGRDNVYHYMINEKWYYYGMVNDISYIIK